MVKPIGEIASEERLLRMRHVGSGAMSAFIANSSASRLAMFKLMAAQSLVLENPDRQTVISGIELDLNNYIFDVKAEEDMEVIAVINKSNGDTGSRVSRTSLIIYRETKSGIHGALEVPTYRRFNTVNGFRMVPTAEYYGIVPDSFIAKGTILATSDNSIHGEYAPGKMANVAFCTLPEVSEDSFLVNREWAEATKYITYQTIEVAVPDDRYLLNLFGDVGYYKPFLSPGDKVPEDGVILAMRAFTEDDAPVTLDMNKKSVVNLATDDIRQITHTGDQYIESIEVVSAHRTKRKGQDYLSYLVNEDIAYYDSILAAYRKINSQNNYEPILSEYLTQLFEKAIMLSDRDVKSSFNTHGVKITKKNRPLPYNTVKVTIRQHHHMNIGGKSTTKYATKGVTVKIVDPEFMPTAQDGTVADIAKDTRTISDRLVSGVSYEQYFNQTSLGVNREIREIANIDYENMSVEAITKHLKSVRLNTPSEYDRIKNTLGEYYSVVTPSFVPYYTSATVTDMDEMLAEALKYGLTLLMPVDDLSIDTPKERVKRLESSKYKGFRDRIWVYDYAKGKKVLTVNPIRIAPLYMHILNKTGSEVSASNSVSLNVFNLTGIKSMKHKHAKPFSSTNVVLLGSMESVMVADVLCPEAYAELLDINSNTSTIAYHSRAVLEEDKPMAMERVVDRDIINLGTSKTHQLLEHLLGAAGMSVDLDRTRKPRK